MHVTKLNNDPLSLVSFILTNACYPAVWCTIFQDVTIAHADTMVIVCLYSMVDLLVSAHKDTVENSVNKVCF